VLVAWLSTEIARSYSRRQREKVEGMSKAEAIAEAAHH
jgi:hypothetical protein